MPRSSSTCSTSSTTPSRTTYQNGESLSRMASQRTPRIGELRAPSTVWTGNAVLGFMSDTDFRDSAGNLPAEVGCRDFHPMWSHPPTAVTSNHDSITFGMNRDTLLRHPTNSKDALVAQCPIVVFKASTVLQSMGIIASRTLLPSSNVQEELRERTYCPTTSYAYGYDSPSKYSDALFKRGAAPILAHECVLFIAQMSNKNQRHPQRANAHAPSAVMSSMMISLTPFTSPRHLDPSSSARCSI